MLYFKEGVKIGGLQPQMLIALKLVEQVFEGVMTDCVVTSANDGKHMTNSLHYTGKAFDFRTRNLERPFAIYETLKRLLEPLEFDVVFEGANTPNQHFHIEWDPKTWPLPPAEKNLHFAMEDGDSLSP